MQPKPRAAGAPDVAAPANDQSAPAPIEDPLIREEVERAMAPYLDLLPPEALAAMREYLGDFAGSHPTMRRLLDRLRPPKEVAKSDVLDKDP